MIGLFHGDTFLLAIYVQETGNHEIINRYAVQSTSGAKSRSEVTSYEFYDNLGMHYFMIFEKKTYTEVAAVLIQDSIRSQLFM